jgi:glucuronate isomerase
MSLVHPDRLFPTDNSTRIIARRLYESVVNLPIISPHGHTDPMWFAENKNFANATELLIIPDHYVYRMLYSQGIPLEKLGIPKLDGSLVEQDAWRIWQVFAENYFLFRGTPSRLWLDHVFENVFGFHERLSSKNARHYFDSINTQLAEPRFKPRALLDRFNIEVIATTESAIDPLQHHARIIKDGLGHRVITAFRPDSVLDPEFEGFADNIKTLAQLSQCDTGNYQGYLKALMERRKFFKAHGATSTDHGHATARTEDLSAAQAEALYKRALKNKLSADEADCFRAHMLTVMARMSIEDGLVMQIHPGSFRNHNHSIFKAYGRDKGADIPTRTDYVRALKPLLDAVGNEPDLNIILFTLDESTYARELAPLAGHYPCLKLGPSWWFHDSPEGMRRFRRNVTETAGFYNTVGFNDDTRAFFSIPARHDVARRIDCGFLAELVSEHRIEEDEAAELAQDLTYHFARRAYRLDGKTNA